MRLLIVGAGATGGYFGARLAQAGRAVTFLVRPERAAQLRRTGLQIVSPHGDVNLVPQLVTAEQIKAPYDAILLSVKSYQLDAALAGLAPAIGSETLLLPVLNGMRHMDLLARQIGARHLIGCALKVATTLDEEGRVVQLAPIQELVYGELDGSTTGRITRLDEFLRGAGFDARLSSHIEREMWEKWILLAALGGITCLMRGSIGDVAAAPGGSAFALRLLDEIVAIVKAVGTPPCEEFLASAREQLTLRDSPFTASMYRDIQKGRPTEAEQIIGDMLRRGQRAGIQAPLLSAAYTYLAIYEARSASS